MKRTQLSSSIKKMPTNTTKCPISNGIKEKMAYGVHLEPCGVKSL